MNLWMIHKKIIGITESNSLKIASGHMKSASPANEGSSG